MRDALRYREKRIVGKSGDSGDVYPKKTAFRCQSREPATELTNVSKISRMFFARSLNLICFNGLEYFCSNFLQ